MLKKLPISVLVLTKNEALNIRQCIESVRWADEIFIIDSGSVDRTLEIAKEYTDKIYSHPFENFAQQRNWAQENLPINNEWVFHLDADEKVSPGLLSEIEKIFSSETDVSGFMMPRKTLFRKRWIKHGGHYPVYHLRLFRKSKGKSEHRLYDQNYIVRGKVMKIEGDIINAIEPDLESWKAKHRKWASMEAREVLFNKSRIMNINRKGNSIERRNWIRYRIYYNLPLFIRPAIYFFYRYVLKLGFLDGRAGFIFHFWQGLWYRFLVDGKIYEYRKRPDMAQHQAVI